MFQTFFEDSLENSAFLRAKVTYMKNAIVDIAYEVRLMPCESKKKATKKKAAKKK